MAARDGAASAAHLNTARWADAIAGLSIAGLLLPEAVAYSSIANLPPQTGIIALFAGLLCYGFLGSSRFAIVSATSSSAAVLAAATASLANGNAALKAMLAVGLVILSGGYFILARLAKLGNITDFVAKPVLRGFAFGLAIVIIIKQIAGIVGMHSTHNSLPGVLTDLLTQITAWNRVGIAVGAVALGLLFVLARFKRVPGGLIVIGLGIAANQWLTLSNYGIAIVGDIHLQLDAPSLPDLSRAEWLRLGELAFAMVMILYSESYGSIRSFAMKHGDAVFPNRDLLALGIANLLSGLFHGMPVGAGYSATSANEAAGAASRCAGGVAAIVILLIVLTVLPYVALTPEPVLAAIVIHAVSHTLSPAIFRPYFTWHRDRLVVITAVFAVLLFGVLDGLLIAIAISLMMMLRRFSESTISILGRLEDSHNFLDVTEHPEAVQLPGMLILRPDEPIFFANAERILGQMRKIIDDAGPTIHIVIVSLEESPDLDSSSIEALQTFFASVASEGKQLLLARLKHSAQQVLQDVRLPNLAGPVLSGLSVDDAVKLAQKNTLTSLSR